MKKKILWLVPAAIAIIVWLTIEISKQDITPETKTVTSPDFASILDGTEKKETFFNYLVPFVVEKNRRILEDRQELTRIIDNSTPPNKEEKRWLGALRGIFKLKKVGVYTPDTLEQLYLHLDVIPESLVLAQAANESAWGTSRFAVKGNNYFGQWCFRKGCGLVPEFREDEAAHEVRRFKDARESVFAYIDNLNSNRAYRSLRNTRAELRKKKEDITGLKLVGGVSSYSQRGKEYVKEIATLIRYNKLWRFNTDYSSLISNESEIKK